MSKQGPMNSFLARERHATFVPWWFTASEVETFLIS